MLGFLELFIVVYNDNIIWDYLHHKLVLWKRSSLCIKCIHAHVHVAESSEGKILQQNVSFFVCVTCTCSGNLPNIEASFKALQNYLVHSIFSWMSDLVTQFDGCKMDELSTCFNFPVQIKKLWRINVHFDGTSFICVWLYGHKCLFCLQYRLEIQPNAFC